MVPKASKARFSVLKAAGTTGGMTLISRLTGFVRDVMIAATLGAGPLADVFVIAFRLPNLFRRLFAEGAFAAAFVPVFAKRLESDSLPAARNMAADILAVLLFSLLGLTALAEIFMPWLVYALAGGFDPQRDKFAQAVYYSRISFPYLVSMSLMALFAAMLNATGRFAVAAFAPVLLNVVLIGALLISYALEGLTLDFLIWGVALAGLVQLGVVWFAAARAGLSLPLKRPRLTKDVKRILVLGVPGVLAAGVGQINLLVGTNIASAQEGAPAWLYYADRLYQLPLGVIGVALSIALLPDISRRLRAGDMKGALNSQNRGMEVALYLTLPASVGLYLLADPILSILFERGAFLAADTKAAALALQGFAFGLPAFVLVKIIQPGFFAREDTASPFIYGAIGVAANISLSLIYFPIYGHAAIAVATSVAGWLTFILLMVHATVLNWHADKQLLISIIGIVLVSALMGLGLTVHPFDVPAGQFGKAIWVAVQVLMSGAIFIVMAEIFAGVFGGMRPLKAFRNMRNTDGT